MNFAARIPCHFKFARIGINYRRRIPGCQHAVQFGDTGIAIANRNRILVHDDDALRTRIGCHSRNAVLLQPPPVNQVW